MKEFEIFFSKVIGHKKEGPEVSMAASFEAGIKVYKQSYQFGHIEKIEAIYLSLAHYLGRENLAYFAFQYLQSYPPDQENIDCFGDRFSFFLKNRKELSDRPEVWWLGQLDWYVYWQNPGDKPLVIPEGMDQYWSYHRGLRSDFPAVNFESNQFFLFRARQVD